MKEKFKPSYSFIEKSLKKAYMKKVWLENNYGRQHGVWFLFTGKLRKYKTLTKDLWLQMDRIAVNGPGLL